jgi:hypothetical protein
MWDACVAVCEYAYACVYHGYENTTLQVSECKYCVENVRCNLHNL